MPRERPQKRQKDKKKKDKFSYIIQSKINSNKNDQFKQKIRTINKEKKEEKQHELLFPSKRRTRRPAQRDRASGAGLARLPGAQQGPRSSGPAPAPAPAPASGLISVASGCSERPPGKCSRYPSAFSSGDYVVTFLTLKYLIHSDFMGPKSEFYLCSQKAGPIS